MTYNFSELSEIKELLVQHQEKVLFMHKSKNYENLGFLKFLKTRFLNKDEIPNKALKIGIWGTFFIHRRTIYFTNVNMFEDIDLTLWSQHAKLGSITWKNKKIKYYKLPLTKNLFHRPHILTILRYELRLHKKHTCCIYPKNNMVCTEAVLFFRSQHMFPKLLENNIYAEHIYKHNIACRVCSDNAKKVLTKKMSTQRQIEIFNLANKQLVKFIKNNNKNDI